jgi:hypothetical protein
MNAHDRANTSDEDPSADEDAGWPWGLIGQIALVLLALGAAGFALYQCAQIGRFEIIFRNDGKPLPLVTQWVLNYRGAFMAGAIFVPCAAAATFALRERGSAIGALVVLILAGVLDGLFVKWALAIPFVVIIKQMGRG